MGSRGAKAHGGMESQASGLPQTCRLRPRTGLALPGPVLPPAQQFLRVWGVIHGKWGSAPTPALPANWRSWCLGKNAFLRYLAKNADLRKFPGEATSCLTCTFTTLPHPTTRRPVCPSPPYCGHSRYCRIRASCTHACPFLPTPLNSPSTVLERERQAFQSLLPSLRELLHPVWPLWSPALRLTAGISDISQPRQAGGKKNAAKPVLAAPPSSLSPGALLDGSSLGILAFFIKHHNLIHTEDGAGSGNLASQVGAKLR